MNKMVSLSSSHSRLSIAGRFEDEASKTKTWGSGDWNTSAVWNRTREYSLVFASRFPFFNTITKCLPSGENLATIPLGFGRLEHFGGLEQDQRILVGVRLKVSFFQHYYKMSPVRREFGYDPFGGPAVGIAGVPQTSHLNRVCNRDGPLG